MQLNEAHFQQFRDEGFLIVNDYLSPQRSAELAAAQRRMIKPWDEVKHDPPADRSAITQFPFTEQLLNRLIIDPPVIDFARRLFGTHEVVSRGSGILVRYPGFGGWSAEHDVPHIDNSGNSLLPPADGDERYGQLTAWYFFEDVGEDQAPLRIIPRRYGKDLKKAIKVAVRGGAICLFNTYTPHAPSPYERADGQRYICGNVYGRRDHHWEGVHSYTNQGGNPHFQKFIGGLTAAERERFNFPAAGHPYYTAKTLAALEEQYPGWNANREYA